MCCAGHPSYIYFYGPIFMASSFLCLFFFWNVENHFGSLFLFLGLGKHFLIWAGRPSIFSWRNYALVDGMTGARCLSIVSLVQQQMIRTSAAINFIGPCVSLFIWLQHPRKNPHAARAAISFQEKKIKATAWLAELLTIISLWYIFHVRLYRLAIVLDLRRPDKTIDI